MKFTKIFYAVLVASATISPAAFAQINSVKGAGGTADSTYQIGAGGGDITKAPKIGQIGDPTLGEGVAAQTYEVILKACEAPFTGVGDEYTRKIYTRTNGTTFNEAFYISKAGCSRDTRALEVKVAEQGRDIELLRGDIFKLLNPPTPVGGVYGTAATRYFLLTTTSNGGSTGSSAKMFVCMNGIRYNDSRAVLPTMYPQPNVNYPADAANPIFWALNQGKPYESWQATGTHAAAAYGPICPGGSYLHPVDAFTVSAPDTP